MSACRFVMPEAGDHLPQLKRELDAASLMAYGAATWDWHRLHYDREYLRERGLDAPVVDGQMFGALCAQAVTGWLGPQAFITKLGYKMRSMVFAGEILTLEGVVTSVEVRGEAVDVQIEQRGCIGDRLAVQTKIRVRMRTQP